jgi:hypothetical protein
MIEITNIQDNQEFFGEELEFFIDDETNIGEVYLDGDLIFQADDCVTEDHLKKQFHGAFIVRYDVDDDNIFMDDDDIYEL